MNIVQKLRHKLTKFSSIAHCTTNCKTYTAAHYFRKILKECEIPFDEIDRNPILADEICTVFKYELESMYQYKRLGKALDWWKLELDTVSWPTHNSVISEAYFIK